MASPSHVLLIEDSDAVVDALRILFESRDYRVSTAGSIADTLAVIADDPPRLALLDLSLPDGNGLELVEPLKAAGVQYVVALTGRDEPEVRERCLAAGCVDVLVKPVPVRELLQRSAAWLGAS